MSDSLSTLGSVLPVFVGPSEVLEKVAEKVSVIDKDIACFVQDMIATMYHYGGIGLAAPQVGKSLRIFITHVNQDPENTVDFEKQDSQVFVFINPQITHFSKKKSNYTEGCLSFPGQSVPTSRSKEVEITYYDLLGNLKKTRFSDLAAICVQHEMDHLNGLTMFDQIIDNVEKTNRKQALIAVKKDILKTNPQDYR